MALRRIGKHPASWFVVWGASRRYRSLSQLSSCISATPDLGYELTNHQALVVLAALVAPHPMLQAYLTSATMSRGFEHNTSVQLLMPQYASAIRRLPTLNTRHASFLFDPAEDICRVILDRACSRMRISPSPRTIFGFWVLRCEVRGWSG